MPCLGVDGDEVVNPLELLPPALRALSASPHEPVLPYEEALAAVEIFEYSRWAVRGWRPDGPGGISAAGEDMARAAGEPWPDYVHRCAECARRGIHRAGDQHRFRLLLSAPD